MLLDGCTTTPRGTDTGCLHGVAWYARTLGTVFLAAITADPPPPLGDALAGAIAEVRARHEKTCDLANPSTPASTVTAVRAARDGFELLALSDSLIVADYGAGRDPVVLTDPHRAASADPDAAGQARHHGPGARRPARHRLAQRRRRPHRRRLPRDRLARPGDRPA